MTRLRRSLVRKVLSSSALVLLLMCAPLQLAAQGRETTAAQGSMLAWFAGFWADLTAWFVSGVVPPPPRPEPPPESTSDNSCAIDPNGGCGG